jgi:hypothetical protein
LAEIIKNKARKRNTMMFVKDLKTGYHPIHSQVDESDKIRLSSLINWVYLHFDVSGEHGLVLGGKEERSTVGSKQRSGAKNNSSIFDRK